jgi:hypothetical protein
MAVYQQFMVLLKILSGSQEKMSLKDSFILTLTARSESQG